MSWKLLSHGPIKRMRFPMPCIAPRLKRSMELRKIRRFAWCSSLPRVTHSLLETIWRIFVSAATGKGDGLAAHGFIDALGRADKPIVAAVPGLAVGVGTTMLLHCDLVYLAEGATLSTPFVNLALVAEVASSMLLPARIGHVRAFAMFALGETISAAEALSLGLANKVLPKDKVLPAARQAARTLATRPLGAIVATKRLMRDKQRILGRMAEEGAVFAQRLQTNEAREAFKAFAERRKPDFTKLAS